MSVHAPPTKRWLKKWARRLVATFGRCVLAAGIPRDRTGARILTYHRVENDPRDPFAVPPGVFREQMAMVAATGRVTTLRKALEGLHSGDSPMSTIALTFDDGTRDFLTAALPVLQEFALPATLYVSPLRVGKEGFLDWAELRQVQKAGIAIESHGLDHRSLGGLNSEELWRQVDQSRRMIEDRLSHSVTSIAYPYGTYRDFDAAVKESVRRSGYQSGCSSVNGLNLPGIDRYELRRTKVESGDMPVFSWILSGCLDGWAAFDRHLARLQNRYS
jgi:peptidoglycan/xylan/chitin deacetylase (PgdA/CDA1 family)